MGTNKPAHGWKSPPTDTDQKLAFLDRFLTTYPSPGRPLTCFYGEAVYLPLIWASLHLQKGDVLKSAGRLAEARACYQAALRIRPDDRVIKGAIRSLE